MEGYEESISRAKDDMCSDFQRKALNGFPIKVNSVLLPCKFLRTELCLPHRNTPGS